MRRVLMAGGSGGGNGVPVRNGLVAEYKFDECRNLLKYSQQFDNAAWAADGETVTANYATAPDGTTTADRVQGSGDDKTLGRTLVVTPLTTYVYSIYLKANSDYGAYYLIIEDVTNSSVIVNSSKELNPSLGWVKHTATFTTAENCTSLKIFAAYTYGSTDINLWGAQLEVVPQTTKNLLCYTEQFDKSAYWVAGAFYNWIRAPIASNDAVAPDGTTTADKIHDTATSKSCGIGRIIGVMPNWTYAFSIWAKLVEGDVQLSLHSGNGGNLVTADVAYQAIIGSTWTRYTLLYTVPPTGVNQIQVGATIHAADTNSAHLWGAQVEVVAQGTKNLLTYTEQFNNAEVWTTTAANITTNQAVAPDGTTTAEKIMETAVDNYHLVQRVAAVSWAAGNYVSSIYVKDNGRDHMVLQMKTAASTWVQPNFNLTALTATGGGVITDEGNGWRRCSIAFTVAAPYASGTFQVLLKENGNYVGDITKGLYIWGAQIEIGSAVTTYEAHPSGSATAYEVHPRTGSPGTYIPTTDKQWLMDYSRTRKNLLLPNVANGCEMGSTLGITNISGCTLTASTEQAWQGTYSLKVVTANSAANERWRSEYIFVEPNLTYTASCYLRGSGTVVLSLHEADDAGGWITSTDSSVITLTGTWTRYSVTRTYGATGRNSALGLYTPTKQAATYYVDGMQIEANQSLTEWTNPPNIGTLGSGIWADSNDPTWVGQGASLITDDRIRAAKDFAYGTGNFTIIVVAKPTDVTNESMLVCSSDGWNSHRCDMAVISNAGRLMIYDAATGGNVFSTFCTVDINTFAMFTARKTGTQTGMCRDNTWGSPADVADIAITNLSPTTKNYLTIGANEDGSACFDGTIAYVAVYTRALTDGEVARVYKFLKSYLLRNRGIVLP